MTDYEFFKSLGICPKCKKHKAAPGRVRCEICLARQAEQTARYREKHGQSPNRYESTKRLRAKRLSEGKCYYCGRPSINGWSCLDHWIQQKRRLEKKNGISRSERPSYCMCYVCGKHIESGTICDKCRDILTKNLAEWQEKNKSYHGGW